MVIDSSALLAILYWEDDAESLAAKIRLAPKSYISAATLVEAWIAVLRRKGERDAADLALLAKVLLIEVIAFDEEQAVLACEAYLRFGRGRHPARLNYGDCFSYALAKSLGEPLLFKGNDFRQTDIPSA
jgi:ribonuclease VapC